MVYSCPETGVGADPLAPWKGGRVANGALQVPLAGAAAVGNKVGLFAAGARDTKPTRVWRLTAFFDCGTVAGLRYRMVWRRELELKV